MIAQKVYILNYNNILDDVIAHYSKTGQLTDNYHKADIFVVWNDVRGSCLEFARIVKEHLNKPLVVMQHGRGAVRDYGQPNKFELLADKILVWGQTEKDRLLKYGYLDSRIDVVGCPIFPRLKPKVKRQGINVLFTPVIAMKEEPENILAYAALKKWECNKLIENIYENFDGLKKAWATETTTVKPYKFPDGTEENRVWKKEVVRKLPRNVTYAKGLLNTKITGVHDMHQYLTPIIASNQNEPDHISATVDLLSNIDVMVCLEEGTMQLLACAMDIPIIHVDIFNYKNYGGVENYDSVEKILTPACYRTNKIEKIGNLVDHALKNPVELRKSRIKVCEQEGGAHLGDLTANAIKSIESCFSEFSKSGRKQELVKV